MDDLDNPLKEVFAKARSQKLEASPFLETRVVARVQEAGRKASRLMIWKTFSALCAAAGLAVVAFRVGLPTGANGQSATFAARVNEGLVVRVEFQKFDRERIAFAEIDLPPGVFFYSKKNPGLREKRTLMIAWDKSNPKPYFPFAIEGKDTGSRVVYVRFLDENYGVVGERKLDIRFSAEG
jgi:hypothetical protein